MGIEANYLVTCVNYNRAGVVKCINNHNDDKNKNVLTVRMKDELGNSITIDITEQVNGILRLDKKQLNKNNFKKIAYVLTGKRVHVNPECQIENLARYIPLSKRALCSTIIQTTPHSGWFLFAGPSL